MNLKPLHDNVIVKPESREEVTKSGIILPETADKERPERGEVVAIGDGRILENGQKKELTVKKGDKVVFKKYSPDEVKIDGEEYLIMSENDIIAIIKK